MGVELFAALGSCQPPKLVQGFSPEYGFIVSAWARLDSVCRHDQDQMEDDYGTIHAVSVGRRAQVVTRARHLAFVAHMGTHVLLEQVKVLAVSDVVRDRGVPAYEFHALNLTLAGVLVHAVRGPSR